MKEVSGSQAAMRRKRPTVTVKAAEHPLNGGPDLQYAVLPGAALETGLQVGKPQRAVAWLATEPDAPISSSDVIALWSAGRARR